MTHDRTWVMRGLRTVAIGTLGLLALQLLLGWTVTDVVQSQVASFDDTLSRWLVDHRTGLGDALSSTASELGHTVTIVVGALGLGVASLAAGRPRAAFVIAVALVMELVVFLVVNTLIARPRPTLPPLGSVPSTHSFPSGHAAASVVLYFGITVLAATAMQPGIRRGVVWTVGTMVALSVGVARAYRAVHHPTDVLAGWLLGAGCLAVTLVAVGGLAAQPSSPWSRRKRSTSAINSSLSTVSGSSVSSPPTTSSSS